MLTKQRMRNAHFARTLDSDPDFTWVGNHRLGKEYGWRTAGSEESLEYRRAYAEAMQEKYASGKAVLESYILTYSPPFVIGGRRPALPKGTVCTYAVDAGHTATEKAIRLAIFRKR